MFQTLLLGAFLLLVCGHKSSNMYQYCQTTTVHQWHWLPCENVSETQQNSW